MIKINLVQMKKGQVDMTNFGGVDLTKVKIKWIILAIALLYAPDFVLVDMWTQEMDMANAEISQLNVAKSRLAKKVSSQKDVEKMINDLKAEEQRLNERLGYVKTLAVNRSNPAALLIFVAKSTPQDLWINDLIIEGFKMTIKGESLDYASIGQFLTNMKNSVFIKESSISKTETKNIDDKKRVESFELLFTIGKFEP